MKSSKKKILVIGGAGYIGSVLCRELLKKNYKVKVFDRLYFGEDGIKDIKDKIELIVGDMRKFPYYILNDVESVINLGGLSNDPTADYNPSANYEMNTISSSRIAYMCREAKVRKYIFASSCSVYFLQNKKEDVIFTEDAKIQPYSAYSVSKYDAEKNIISLSDKNFSPVALRLGTVFGFSFRMRYDLVVNTFVKDAISRKCITVYDGDKTYRPLIDIRDVACTITTVLQTEERKIKGQIFNLAFENWKISDLALRIKDILKDIGIKTDIVQSCTSRDSRSYQVSSEKIKAYLNIKPSFTLESGVIDLIEKIKKYNFTDFENPKYYNIRWMMLLEETEKIIKLTGSIF